MNNDPELNAQHRDSQTCPHCGLVGMVPALEHNRGCKLRLEFFGGDASWPQGPVIQWKGGESFYWDETRGTWAIITWPEAADADKGRPGD